MWVEIVLVWGKTFQEMLGRPMGGGGGDWRADHGQARSPREHLDGGTQTSVTAAESQGVMIESWLTGAQVKASSG